jgi:hypothetical protein
MDFSNYITQAKILLSIGQTTNAELVLAHLLQMRTTQTSFRSKEIKTVIFSRVPKMSEMVFRKSLHELRKNGILKKEFGIYTLNLK